MPSLKYLNSVKHHNSAVLSQGAKRGYLWMRTAPSFFVPLINWELFNAGGFWPWEHCSPKALKCQHWPGHSSCWSCWTQDPGPWTIAGELSAEGQDFCEELVGFKALVLFSSGNFSPKIKSHLRTTMATAACVAVYIVSFRGNLGRKPQ